MTSEDLVTLVARQYGLVPRRDSVTRVEGALAELGARLDLQPADCARRVGDDPVLLRALAGALVVEETYFLRIPEHFACVAAHVSERLAPQDISSPVRVWSAGCSTGEEAYSIAMWLDRYLPPGLARRVEIVASDVNRRALAVAEAGVYGPWSFRDVGAEWRERYFEPAAGSRLRVTDRLRRAVRFVHFSVQEHLAILPAACFDIVLFRNVAIYLAAEARRRVYGDMARVLAPGGLLILAGTDPVPEDPHLHRTDHASCSVYVQTGGATLVRRKEPIGRRRSRGELRVRVGSPVAAGSTPRRCRRAPHPLGASRVAPGRPGQTASMAPGSRRGSAVPRPEPAPVIRDLQRAAQAHADADRVDDALELAARLVDVDPAGWQGYFLRGQLHLSVLRPGAAVEDLRRAVFVAPENALARYWYVLALWRAGESRQALAQNRELEDLLDGLPAQALLEEGTTVGQLRDAVRSLREGMA